MVLETVSSAELGFSNESRGGLVRRTSRDVVLLARGILKPPMGTQDASTEAEVTDERWLGGVIDGDGCIGEGNDVCVVVVIESDRAVGLGDTYLAVVACLKNRGGNAWRLVPCARFRDLSRCWISSLVFLSTRLPLPEPGNWVVTRTQSI